jgi:hypothetical protein
MKGNSVALFISFLVSVITISLPVHYLIYTANKTLRTPRDTLECEDLWVVPSDGWLATGSIAVNGNNVFASEDKVGDVTILRKGNQVRSKYIYGKMAMNSADEIRTAIQGELRSGCGIREGCRAVNVHQVRVDGLIDTIRVESLEQVYSVPLTFPL